MFPSLATRPLFLTGESYAGTYIVSAHRIVSSRCPWPIDGRSSLQPYITKHIFQAPNPPINLSKIAIGDGSLGSQATVEHLPVVSYLPFLALR